MEEKIMNKDEVQKEINDFMLSSENYLSRTIGELGDIMQYLLTEEINIVSVRDKCLQTLAECRFTYKFLLDVSQKWENNSKSGEK